MIQRISGVVQTLRFRWAVFFWTRCLAGLPWYWPARPLGARAMVDARRMVRRNFGRGHHPVYRVLARVLVAAAWTPAVLVHLWQFRRWQPEAVPIKRVPRALWAAMRHNILPGEYLAYALWKPDHRANIDNYLYSHESSRLLRLLNRPCQPDPIDDKMAFHEMCMAHTIPTPPILAAFGPSRNLLEFESGRPPERDLFVKPRMGLAGEGAERFRWHGGAFESDRGCRLRPEDLDGYLATRAENEKRTLLVQPVLLNHPGLHVDTNAALATVRLVTGRSADGDVVPIYGFIYFARPDAIMAKGGHIALIDVASGQLMSAPPKGIWGAKLFSYHQFTDDSRMLPDWDAALLHTKVAHHACPNFVFVGWDIALTDRGPMLLEGNAGWSADEYQSLTGEPLGNSAQFIEILAAGLRGCQAKGENSEQQESPKHHFA
jgi:Sugar-transfer associated ATP-grasp